ncbi:TniB family NTP-binding protein [Aliivibrio sp. S10_S31]|uniref:TniB family NTP-binding protein n=1 Tax=Aliivibrio sp. S10_S31 TaxID=2720224 RepID=UPI001681314C|nr:TniB family NTP-binding protein [Aliivibrio sp. S10_S31]MBD1568030.1 AAA family ATPase [Aliivibrio sp. S10_S31]
MHTLSSVQKEQLINFNQCFIEYPIITHIYSIFDDLRMNQNLGAEPQCMLLLGDTGSGKSALINNYLLQQPSSNFSALNSLPILHTRIPRRVNNEQTMYQLLSDLRQSPPGSRRAKRSEIALAEGVVRALQRKKTELIIINEFQELIEFSSAKERQNVANTLKYISEEARVSIVLVGMPYADIIAEEPQWGSRLAWKTQIEYFSLKNDMKTYIQFLKGLANRMGYDEVPSLHNKELAIPLFSICRGELRQLKNFCSDAMLESFKQNKNTLTHDVLSATFKYKYPTKKNPFEMNVADVPIQEVESYSKYNLNAMTDDERLTATKFLDAISLSSLLSKS